MVFFIIKGRKEARALHWREIKKRVRTHEGELLSGEKGKRYQEKYSKKYLGRDLSQAKPVDKNDVEKFEYFEARKDD